MDTDNYYAKAINLKKNLDCRKINKKYPIISLNDFSNDFSSSNTEKCSIQKYSNHQTHQNKLSNLIHKLQ